ncbi:hypothetical protein COU36_02285 [Candidatus Micrarchaeota archaeon CG10_big_fil_rev_8_21_14_0_10_59_7]|nr:MAG: hypothetical protein COU36_02285 [Candidatus Micrarchaeota archaeon CG10_big_fil_rev_8_21_14_0_10_59_7]
MRIKTALFLTLIAASFAFALNASDEARFYAETGETATLVQLSEPDDNIYMVLTNNAETVLLEQRAGRAEPITDEARITELVKRYLQARFDSYNFSGKRDSIASDFLIVNETAGGCAEGVRTFIPKTIYAMPYLLIRAARSQYHNEYDAMMSLNETYPAVEDAVLEIQGSIVDMDAAISRRDIDRISKENGDIRRSAETIKDKYANLTVSHDLIVASFYYAFYVRGDPRSCSENANLTMALSGIMDATGGTGFPNSTRITSQVIGATATRKERAETRHTIAAQTETLNKTAYQVNATVMKYKAVNKVEIVYLNTKLGELQMLHGTLINSLNTGGNTSLKAIADNFTKTNADMDAFLKTYNDLYPTYSLSVLAVANATSSIDDLTKRLGNNEERVVDMQRELQTLKISLRSNEAFFKQGKVNTQIFGLIATNATSLATRAQATMPKENEIDFVTIGGGLILLLTLAGGFYYLKKMKDEEKALGGEPVDIRKLQQPEQQKPAIPQQPQAPQQYQPPQQPQFGGGQPSSPQMTQGRFTRLMKFLRGDD